VSLAADPAADPAAGNARAQGRIRPAREDDLPAIVAFWNPVIAGTTSSFHSELKTVPGLAQMIAARRAAGREFLVWDEGGAILGFVTYDQFRPGDGYARTMEHTVILAAQARGRGVGRALMEALCDHAAAAGAHVMVAAVDAANAAGLAFHAACGFEAVGRMPQTGAKFGRWLDLVLMQRLLGPADVPPPG